MDNDTVKIITRIETKQEGIVEDIKEIKGVAKSSKGCYASKESMGALEKRVEKLENNNTKILWLVITAVIGAVLNLVIK